MGRFFSELVSDVVFLTCIGSAIGTLYYLFLGLSSQGGENYIITLLCFVTFYATYKLSQSLALQYREDYSLFSGFLFDAVDILAFVFRVIPSIGRRIFDWFD